MGQGAVYPSPLVGAQGVGVLKERAFLRHREGSAFFRIDVASTIFMLTSKRHAPGCMTSFSGTTMSIAIAGSVS